MKKNEKKMKHIKAFENFINEEVDSSLLGGVSKNIYLELKNKPINQPLSKEGKPMMNVKGEPIKYTDKVKMSYQNEELGKKGQAKYLNRQANNEIDIHFNVNWIYITGFQKEEEAKETLDFALEKYPKELTGVVKKSIGERGWGDTYTVSINLKNP